MDEKILAIAIIAAIAIAGYIFYVSNETGNPEALAILGVSQVNFDSGGQVWVASMAINSGGDTLRFYKTQSFQDVNPDGSKVEGNADLYFSFGKLQEQCQYNLAWSSFIIPDATTLGLTSSNYKYANLNIAQRSFPITISLSKNSGTPETITVDTRTANIQTMANGAVKIQNLGALSNGVNCPDADSAVLIEQRNSSGNPTGKYMLKSKADFVSWQRTIVASSCNPLDIFNFGNCASKVIQSLYQPPIQSPSGWTGLTTNVASISNGSLNFTASGAALNTSTVILTFEVSKDYADTVSYNAPQCKPSIVSFNPSTTNFNVGQSSTLTANIKNIGSGACAFQILATTTASGIQLSPAVGMTNNLPAGASQNVNIVAYGLNQASNARVCLEAVGGAGSSGQNCISNLTVNATQGIPQINEQPIENCGNGICVASAGETQQTCPQDCGVYQGGGILSTCGDGKCEGLFDCAADCQPNPATPAQQLTCNFPQTLSQKSEKTWFGLGAVQTTTSCIFDPVIALLIVLVAIGAPIAYFQFKK